MARTVARVTQEGARRRIAKARVALQSEVRLVKDLQFLKTLRLTVIEEDALDKAIRKAASVSLIYSEQYVRAVVELLALTGEIR